MSQNIFSSERVTFMLESTNKPALNAPVTLDTSGVRKVKVADAQANIIIGAIETVEKSNTDGIWQVTVPVSAPIKEMTVTGTVAIGNRLVLNSSVALVAQAVNLSGTAFKHSVGIALNSVASGVTADIEVLQVEAYIPV